MINITFDDLVIMARTVFGEARGETLEGQEAVAAVILNRANHPTRWAHNITEVCQQPWQFSCWNDNDVNREKLLDEPVTSRRMKIAFNACLMAISGKDTSHGANHYFATYIDKPKWAEGMKKTLTIGVHAFYKAE